MAAKGALPQKFIEEAAKAVRYLMLTHLTLFNIIYRTMTKIHLQKLVLKRFQNVRAVIQAGLESVPYLLKERICLVSLWLSISLRYETQRLYSFLPYVFNVDLIICLAH